MTSTHMWYYLHFLHLLQLLAALQEVCMHVLVDWWKKSGRGSLADGWQLKPETLDLTPGGTTFLSFPLLFQRSMDSNGPDYIWLHDHYWSSHCGGVPSIRFPMWWFCSPFFMINNCTQQSNMYLIKKLWYLDKALQRHNYTNQEFDGWHM